MSSSRSQAGARALAPEGLGAARRWPVRILGIDPGSRIVGYAVVDAITSHQWSYVECGVLRTDEGARLPERLSTVIAGLDELVAEFAPRDLAVERAFCGRNAASALRLGEARGAILVAAARAGLAIGEYAPARIKRLVVGHGRATKAQVIERVSALCRLKRPPRSDAADALAIALCHALTLGANPEVMA